MECRTRRAGSSRPTTSPACHCEPCKSLPPGEGGAKRRMRVDPAPQSPRVSLRGAKRRGNLQVRFPGVFPQASAQRFPVQIATPSCGMVRNDTTLGLRRGGPSGTPAPTTHYCFCGWNVVKRNVGDGVPYSAFSVLRMEGRGHFYTLDPKIGRSGGAAVNRTRAAP